MDGQLLYASVGITLVFAFINGFDGGSVIATLVCSRAMRPRRALVLVRLQHNQGKHSGDFFFFTLFFGQPLTGLDI